MAKRPLGISQNAKSKRQKQQQQQQQTEPSADEARPQLTLEVADNEDPEDTTAQLKSLWLEYFRSDRESEALINGIVNEGSSIMQQFYNGEIKLADLKNEFLAVLALALSELTIFKAGEEYDESDAQAAATAGSADKKGQSNEERKEVKEFFDRALEVAQLKMDSDGDDNLLNLVIAKIIFQRVPLEYISRLQMDSSEAKLKLHLFELLESGMRHFRIVEDDLELTFEVLCGFSDLLDIVENFGNERKGEDGLDSDDEAGDEAYEEELLERINLNKDHPLYRIRADMENFYSWLREKLLNLFDKIDGEVDKRLYSRVANAIGDLYLREAEPSSRTFMKLKYGDIDEEQGEGNAEDKLSDEDKKLMLNSQSKAIAATTTALEYLEKAQLSDDPETWVHVAEASIDLGNLYDYESKEQDKAYAKAEELLKKANVATQNKYSNVLENLLFRS